MNENYYDFKLMHMVQEGEKVLWQGKPDKRCFVLECIFNPFLPIAFIWFLIDATFIFFFLTASTVNINGQKADANEALQFIIPFFAIHMMPVWIYIAGVIRSIRRYSSAEYILTDKALYISRGTSRRITYDQISDIQIRQGFFDRMLNVGDVIIEKSAQGYRRTSDNDELAIVDISLFKVVYDLIIQKQKEEKARKSIQENKTIENIPEKTPEDISENADGYRRIDLE